MRHAHLWLVLLFGILCLPLLRAADATDGAQSDATQNIKKLIEGGAADRDEAAIGLHKLGKAAIPALRDAKPEKEAAQERVRNILTEIAIETAEATEADANLLHDLAREEGNAKRYGNAERLYRNAERKYDLLKDLAGEKKNRAKKDEFSEKRKICDRMKDKAGHKIKGENHSGLNLGFIKIGKENDMSDDWE